jgi:hypothetical protein
MSHGEAAEEPGLATRAAACLIAAIAVSLPGLEDERYAASEWAIVDSNHGPPPYQSGALTD